MIRAVLKKGKVQLLEKLPQEWREGQQLIIKGAEPSSDPSEIEKWYKKLVALSKDIPTSEHKRLADALNEQRRLAKKRTRQDMGL